MGIDGHRVPFDLIGTGRQRLWESSNQRLAIFGDCGLETRHIHLVIQHPRHTGHDDIHSRQSGHQLFAEDKAELRRRLRRTIGGRRGGQQFGMGICRASQSKGASRSCDGKVTGAEHRVYPLKPLRGIRSTAANSSDILTHRRGKGDRRAYCWIRTGDGHERPRHNAGQIA